MEQKLTAIGWLLAFALLTFLVPAEKLQTGYIWRVLILVPPFRFIRDKLARWFLLITTWAFFVSRTGFFPKPIQDPLFWGLACLLYLDDYFNGDDDLWKKLKKLGNKIKWKMVLPQPQQASGKTG